MTRNAERRTCAICGRPFAARELVAAPLVREAISEVIRRDHPGWSSESVICRGDLTQFRTRYVHSLLESEKGDLTSLEQEVLNSLREHELLSTNVEAQFERVWSKGERLADRIAVFGGSWTPWSFINCRLPTRTDPPCSLPLSPRPVISWTCLAF